MAEKLKVAVYCRFGCVEESISYEALEKRYKEFISTHEDWEYSKIYIDEGFGATKTRQRPELNKLIDDCKNGKVDIIVTKDISRFYRNIVDVINFVKELETLNPPIKIYFETTGMYRGMSGFIENFMKENKNNG